MIKVERKSIAESTKDAMSEMEFDRSAAYTNVHTNVAFRRSDVSRPSAEDEPHQDLATQQRGIQHEIDVYSPIHRLG